MSFPPILGSAARASGIEESDRSDRVVREERRLELRRSKADRWGEMPVRERIRARR